MDWHLAYCLHSSQEVKTDKRSNRENKRKSVKNSISHKAWREVTPNWWRYGGCQKSFDCFHNKKQVAFPGWYWLGFYCNCTRGIRFKLFTPICLQRVQANWRAGRACPDVRMSATCFSVRLPLNINRTATDDRYCGWKNRDLLFETTEQADKLYRIVLASSFYAEFTDRFFI